MYGGSCGCGCRRRDGGDVCGAGVQYTKGHCPRSGIVGAEGFGIAIGIGSDGGACVDVIACHIGDLVVVAVTRSVGGGGCVVVVVVVVDVEFCEILHY